MDYFHPAPTPLCFSPLVEGHKGVAAGNERAEGVWVTGEVRALTKAGNGTEKESARNRKSLIWSFA